MTTVGIAFAERVISLDAPDFKATLLGFSPVGKVPVLLDGDMRVWESLAILDHLAERYPAAGLWPEDLRARAHARSIACEMHASFTALRRHCPMNMWRPVKRRELTEAVAADVRHIDAMWGECIERYGGPLLFGRFTAADAMYAPVVSRFHTYEVPVGATARAYMDAMMALPAWAEWKRAALAEPWVLPEDEPDWPTVLKEPAAT